MKKVMNVLSFLVMSATAFSQPSVIVAQKDVEAVCNTIR